MIKKLLVFLLPVSLLCNNILEAQPQYSFTVVTSVANNFPFNDVTNNRRQNLYLPTDFPTAPSGAITKLYFLPSGTGTYNFTNLTISMGPTLLPSFTTGPWAGGLTQVYTGTGSFTTGVGGWIEVPLTTPFSYNNTQNFVVDVSQTGFAPGFAAIHDGAVGSTNRALYGNVAAATGTQQTRLLRLGFDMQLSCDSPININTVPTRFTADITWDPRPGAASYEYLIDQSPLDPPSNGYAFTNVPVINLKNLPDGTCYYIHIRTICSGLFPQSGWSLDSFCTVADCKVPEVTIENVLSTTAIASWAAVPGAYGYEYSTGTTPTPPTVGMQTTYTSVKLQGLTPNKPLYFYVRAKCTPTPLSEWGVTPFHTMAYLGIDETGNRALSIEAFPNPVKEKMLLRIYGQRGNNAMVTLTDIAGRAIAVKPVNADELVLDMEKLAPGMYFAKYADENGSTIIKVNKQ